jgi:hypothetical protein
MRYPSRIRILVPISGPGVFFKPGPEPVKVGSGTVPDPAEALRWVNGGIAEAVEWADAEEETESPPAAPAPGEIETTMLGTPEAAVTHRGRPPGRRSKK